MVEGKGDMHTILNKINRTKILWIDDNIAHFKYNIANLALANYDLLCTDKATEFLNLLDSHPIDIAIVDLNLNDMNSGRDLIKLLKSNFPAVKIIIYSKMITRDQDFKYDSDGSMMLSIDPTEALKLDTKTTKLDEAISTILKNSKETKKLRLIPSTNNTKPTWSPKWQLNSRNARFCLTKLMPFFGLVTLGIKFSAKSGSGLSWVRFLLEDKLLIFTGVFFILVIVLNSFFCPSEIRKKTSRESFLSGNLMLYENDRNYAGKVDAVLAKSGIKVLSLKPFNKLSTYYDIENTKHPFMRWLVFLFFCVGISLALLSVLSSLIMAIKITAS